MLRAVTILTLGGLSTALTGCQTTTQNYVERHHLSKNCDYYWAMRDEALRRGDVSGAEKSVELYRKCMNYSTERVVRSSDGSSIGNALLMGLICSSTPNASACITGAAEAMVSKDTNQGDTERRLKEAEQKMNQLEQSQRNRCVLKGGIYSPYTGCSK